MDLPPIKIIKSKRHIKKTARYIGNFTYLSFAAGIFCILYSVLYVVINLLGNTDVVSDAAELWL